MVRLVQPPLPHSKAVKLPGAKSPQLRNVLHQGHRHEIHIVLGFQSATTRQGPHFSAWRSRNDNPEPTGRPTGRDYTSLGQQIHVSAHGAEKWTQAEKAAQPP